MSAELKHGEGTDETKEHPASELWGSWVLVSENRVGVGVRVASGKQHKLPSDQASTSTQRSLKPSKSTPG